MADGPDLFVAWTSNVPAGTIFQVYVDRRLAWYGASRRCHVPIPSGGLGRNHLGRGRHGRCRRADRRLFVEPGRTRRPERAGQLAWSGGTYLDPTGRDDIQGFRIYQSPTPGAAVDLTTSGRHRRGLSRRMDQRRVRQGRVRGRRVRPSRHALQLAERPACLRRLAIRRPPVRQGRQRPGRRPSRSTVTINAAPRPPATDANRARLTSDLRGAFEPATDAQLAAQPLGVTSVATTYTANARLQKPATSDRNWDVPINANADALDGMTAIGGLAVTTTEIPERDAPGRASRPAISSSRTGSSSASRAHPAFVVPAILDGLPLADRRRRADVRALVPDLGPPEAGPGRLRPDFGHPGGRRAHPVFGRGDGPGVRPQGGRHDDRPADGRLSLERTRRCSSPTRSID